MTVDTVLQRLARIPRPAVSAFLSARVTAHATGARRPARAPRLMWIYWTALAGIGGPFLLTSWERVALVATGAMAVRVVVAMTAGAPGERRYSRRNDVRPNSL